MCGLLILKYVRNLSDESVVEQWSESAQLPVLFLGPSPSRTNTTGIPSKNLSDRCTHYQKED